MDIDVIPGCRQFVMNKLKTELPERKSPQTEKYLSQTLFESKVFDGNTGIWKLVLDGNDFVKDHTLKDQVYDDFKQILKN